MGWRITPIYFLWGDQLNSISKILRYGTVQAFNFQNFFSDMHKETSFCTLKHNLVVIMDSVSLLFVLKAS